MPNGDYRNDINATLDVNTSIRNTTAVIEHDDMDLLNFKAGNSKSNTNHNNDVIVGKLGKDSIMNWIKKTSNTVEKPMDFI